MTLVSKAPMGIILFILFFGSSAFGRLNCKYYLNSDYQPIPKMMEQANENYKNRQYQQSIEFLTSILTIDRRDAFAMSLLARNYYLVKSFELALKAQTRVLQLEKSYNEGGYFSMAQILMSLGQKDKALEYLNTIIENNPKHLAALGLAARLRLDKNEFEVAYDLIHRKLEVDPKDTHALSLFVEYYYKRNQYPQALKFAQRLVNENTPRKNQERVPRAYRSGLALRAKVLVALGGKANLENALKDIAILEPMMANTSGWVGLLKAEAYFKLGELSQSLNVLVSGVRTSQSLDLAILAAMVKIEQAGSRSSQSTNLLLQAAFKQLNQTEIIEVLRLSKQTSWDFTPLEGVSLSPGVIVNNFWSVLYHMPVDGQTFRSTY